MAQMQVNPNHPPEETTDTVAAPPVQTESQPETAETWTQLAETYCSRGQFTDALAACQQAILLQPQWALAYVTMGNAYHGQGDVDAAIRAYSEALKLNPNLAQAHANLGSMFFTQNRYEEAIASYRQAVNLNPDLAAVHWNLAKVLKKQGRLAEAQVSEQKALALNPQLGGVNFLMTQGNQLAQQGKLEEAIACWQNAIALKPDLAEAYCQIGMLLRHQSKYQEAVPLLEKAIQFKPDLIAAHQHLCGIFRDSTDQASARKAVNRYNELCSQADPIMTAIYLISTYQVSGLNQIAKDRFLEFESQLNQRLYATSVLETRSLYANLLFSVPYLRDDIEKNTQLHQRITQRYINQILKPQYKKSHSKSKPNRKDKKGALKIGILSSHFNRHSVGWCSADVIRELAKIYPEIYLYFTDKPQTDDRTVLFEKIARQFFIPQKYPNGLAISDEIVAAIQKDEIDILLDLDALSMPIHADIFYQHPAPVCISWLGFDALQISSKNYFLGDWHTHPQGQEKYYTEQLIRMPHSFVAVSGFNRIPVDPATIRRSYRISLDQIVYLCVAPGRKFNRDLAKAQVAILKQVPDSVLVHKALGDAEVFQTAYWDACEELGVGKHRIKFIPRFATEEEHRQIYALADVLLDSYPYNGGTHTLEALWFNVPVVTLKGSQFLSRMGYSFLQGVGITTGVAESWQEYTDLGIRFGRDSELRKSVQEQLINSKNPNQLAPLWNPSQFAQDLSQIFEPLLAEVRK